MHKPRVSWDIPAEGKVLVGLAQMPLGMSVWFLVNRLWLWCSTFCSVVVWHSPAAGPVYSEDLLSGLQGCVFCLSLLPLSPRPSLGSEQNFQRWKHRLIRETFCSLTCEGKSDPRGLRSPGLRPDPTWCMGDTPISGCWARDRRSFSNLLICCHGSGTCCAGGSLCS